MRDYGIRNFFFRADTFTWDKEWVIAVCKEILNRKLDIQWVANSRANIPSLPKKSSIDFALLNSAITVSGEGM